jgi:hypothetical protein
VRTADRTVRATIGVNRMPTDAHDHSGEVPSTTSVSSATSTTGSARNASTIRLKTSSTAPR